MKKIIALILALAMAMSMSAGCGCACDCDEQNQLITEETVAEATVVGEADDALLAALTNHVNSGNYDNMYAVAECEYATESHLKSVANYASHYGYERLASAIINNSNKTLKVLQELSKSGDSEVANLAHKAIESWNE